MTMFFSSMVNVDPEFYSSRCPELEQQFSYQLSVIANISTVRIYCTESSVKDLSHRLLSVMH